MKRVREIRGIKRTKTGLETKWVNQTKLNKGFWSPNEIDTIDRKERKPQVKFDVLEPFSPATASSNVRGKFALCGEMEVDDEVSQRQGISTRRSGEQ